MTDLLQKEGMWSSSDVVWQLRVDFPVLAHPPCQQSTSGRPQLKSCNRRRQKYAATKSSVRCGFSDKKKVIKCCGNGYLVSEAFRKGCGNSAISSSRCIKASLSGNQLIEEPWLGNSTSISHSLSDKNGNRIDYRMGYESESQKADISFQTEHKENIFYSGSETDGMLEAFPSFLPYLPVEEPWLFDSSSDSYYSHTDGASSHTTPNDQYIPVAEDLLHIEETNVIPDASTSTTPNEQHNPIAEDLVPIEETALVPVEESISTVILINSSVCTMQRIAVLENDKLVELLLEPVKSNVQCDSVYLGIVEKLVPQMGGAFVNIGSSRLSFMDLNPNREPFVFFPFQVNPKETDRSTFDSSALQTYGTDNISESDMVEEIDDVDDDQGEDEFIDVRSKGTERDFHIDILKVINGNVTGTSNGSGHETVQENSVAPSVIDLGQDAEVKDGGVKESLWSQVQNGSRILVQVIKEGLGTKGPTVTAYPKLRSRFWVLSTRCKTIGISKKVTGAERSRLRTIAKTLQPPGFGITLRTVASGHSLEELKKDLEGLLFTWKSIIEHAKSAALAADEGVEGAVPVLLHRAMAQTLSVAQDYFNEKINKMVVDSARTYHEVTKYLQDIDPNLCSRVELYSKRTPLFNEYNIEDEIDGILQKRVPLANGGYLVIEQTEALVSIDVNGGHCMLGQGNSQEKAIFEVNLVAAKQIARELRLRDIGGIIVVDFIDMEDDASRRLVYEEVKKAVERDRSNVKVSELSRNGLMEITRKRVRPSVTFMISEPCSCCNSTGRVLALETSFSKIEHEICRLLSMMEQNADPEKPKSWPRFILRVERHMCNYLTSGKKTRLAVLSSCLKVWILLKVARGLARGAFELKALAEGSAQKKQHSVAAISVLRPKELVTIKKWKTNRK